MKVLRDGLRQFAGGFQRGGAGRLSSVRGARARPAICSLRLGRDGARDALATRIATAAGRVRVLSVKCSQEMAASGHILLVTKIFENATDLMRAARDLGVDQSSRMLAKRKSRPKSARIAAAAAGRAVRVLSVECSQEMAASGHILLMTKIYENAADLMRGARDLGVDQSLRNFGVSKTRSDNTHGARGEARLGARGDGAGSGALACPVSLPARRDGPPQFSLRRARAAGSLLAPLGS